MVFTKLKSSIEFKLSLLVFQNEQNNKRIVQLKKRKMIKQK